MNEDKAKDVAKRVLDSVGGGDWKAEAYRDAAAQIESYATKSEAFTALYDAAKMVDDWFAGRIYNGQDERAAMAAKARAAILLADRSRRGE